MAELALLLVGIALQIGGVALTVVGARVVWRDVKRPEDRFFAPFIRAGRWISRQARRALRAIGVPMHHQAIIVDAIDTGSYVGTPRIVQSFAPLSAGLTTQQALAELDDRLRKVQALAYEQAESVETRVRQEVERLTEEQRQAKQTADETQERERRTAVQGLRLEAYGFILLTLGTFVQAWGSYLGIGS